MHTGAFWPLSGPWPVIVASADVTRMSCTPTSWETVVG